MHILINCRHIMFFRIGMLCMCFYTAMNIIIGLQFVFKISIIVQSQSKLIDWNLECYLEEYVLDGLGHAFSSFFCFLTLVTFCDGNVSTKATQWTCTKKLFILRNLPIILLTAIRYLSTIK